MEGYRWEFEEAKGYLDRLECPNVVVIPGNHDAKNVGYRHFEEYFGMREGTATVAVPEGEAKVVAIDSTKPDLDEGEVGRDRKSTRLNSSHATISYAVFCLKKTKNNHTLSTNQPPPIVTRSENSHNTSLYPHQKPYNHKLTQRNCINDKTSY